MGRCYRFVADRGNTFTVYSITTIHQASAEQCRHLCYSTKVYIVRGVLYDMKRRSFVVGFGGCIVAISGCTTDDSPSVGLGRITVSNDLEEPVELRLIVTKDGDQAHDNEYTVDGRAVNGVDLESEWMGDSVQYEVTAILPDDGIERTVTSDELEQLVSEWGDTNCYHIDFVVESENIRAGLFTLDYCP